MNKKDYKKIANFLYELGGMRKLPRIHMQTLITNDFSDNIASHSFRVAMIGWIVAKLEGNVDVNKVIQMCLMHDVAEIRSGDHNWVHKKYVKIFEDEIKSDQMNIEFLSDLKEALDEYDDRKSKESIIAKDADMLDQILLLREYVWQGNKEAEMWLTNKGDKFDKYRKVKELKTKNAKKLGKMIYDTRPSEWWDNAFSSANR